MTRDKVTVALERYDRANAAVDATRAGLVIEVGRAVFVYKRRQSDIARLTGYSREHIRRMCLEYAELALNEDTEF